MIDRTAEYGLDVANRDARLPVWLDYDNDHRLDVVVTQYGGIAKLFHQNAAGGFTETTSAAKLLCARFHYAQLFDADGDGRLDFLCPDEAAFPQKIYGTASFPWKKLFDSAQPSAFFPVVHNVADSAIADFDNDGRMDLFVLGGVQLRPSSVVQGGTSKVEALLAGGSKGFRFVSTGSVTFTVDWNNGGEGAGTDITKIEIGAHGTHPKAAQFTLDPNDPTVAGTPPAPTSATTLPVMQIGYDPTIHQWTLAIVTRRTSASRGDYSAKPTSQVSSTAAISGLVATGLWPTDGPGRPTLLMNRAGGLADETVAAGLGTAVQCASVTAGDFDNDMYVDLYLACRTGASNIANILYHNNGNGTFTAVANAGGAAGPIGLAIADGVGTADSVVTADYDVDGFLDLFVTNGFNLQPRYVGGPNKLFHNNGNANHWIELDLIGVNSDRDATGARVYATANGVTQLRVQDGRYHRWSQDAKRLHFGLAGATSVSLSVKWPSGATQTFADVPANRLYQLTEGASNPVPVVLKVPASPPTGLTATAGNASVQLAWTAVPGATSYNVYQGTTAGGEGATAVMSAITTTTANVTPLANGTTYYFVVSADTAAGASGPSSEVSATPEAPASSGGGSNGGANNSGGGGDGTSTAKSGGGGALDFWSLLGIAVLGARRRRKLA